LLGGVGIVAFDLFASLNGVSYPLIDSMAPQVCVIGVQILVMAIIISQLKYVMKRQYQRI